VAVWNQQAQCFFISADRQIKKVERNASPVFVGSGNFGHLDGDGLFCSFWNIRAMVVNSAGELLVIDDTSLRKVTLAGEVRTVEPEGFLPDTGLASLGP